MKVSDIMRDIADLIDQKMSQGPTPDSGMSTNSTETKMTQVTPEPGDDGEPQPKMVPPLQAKLEILKKSEGIPNVYDEEGTDELAMIKKNAGITTAQQEASDDEPLDQ